MKAFLEYVAEDIVHKHGGNLSNIAIVFPNKRAALFMNEYLFSITEKTMWGPAYITISDLISQHSKLQLADQILLICELYKSYSAIIGASETLDQFYGWGELMLSDFDDIDKNMANADEVFSNLKNIHQLDDVSYLTDEQKEALKRFFGNFDEGHETKLKKRFLELWSNFGNIYHDYNKRLAEQHIAYEGALYRQVADDENIVFRYDKYIFVGFNVVQRAEQKIFNRLQESGKAEFYWNFDKYYMTGNEAGGNISQYLKYYPNELDNNNDEIYDNFSKKKNITYISSTTETMQARYISSWLKENDRLGDGKKTAIVLCDESLLQTVIHSLPPEAKEVNITMGYPLAQTPFASLIDVLIKLQTIGHPYATDKYRLRYVSQALQHPYAKFISEECQRIIDQLKAESRYYPTRGELSVDEGLTLLFSDIERTDLDANGQMLKWLLSILKLIARNADSEDSEMFNEALFKTYTLLNRLSQLVNEKGLAIDKITLQRLIRQLMQSTKIPFHGEPVVGLQIMGVLETRNLDFDHLLILSCNEGNMPKGINDSSFIPYSIRKAFGLTTIDNKVAIYSYYFHSLLQRASDITIAYNNSTEDGHTGEMSRFMLQLMVEGGNKIERRSLQPGKTINAALPKPISKSEKIISTRLSGMKGISPSAINRYIRCQLIFYFNDILDIKEPDETDEETIDNRMFGNIFHKSAKLIYDELSSSSKYITPQAIDAVLRNKTLIERKVDQAFKEELFKPTDTNFKPEYNGIQLINRSVIISYLRRLLEIDKSLAPLTMHAAEKEVDHPLAFNVGQNRRSIIIHGIIDRIDEITRNGQNTIRVVDYKTGRKPQQEVKSIEEIFSGANLLKNHSDYYLQTMLYSLQIRNDRKYNPGNLPVSPALLFIQKTRSDDYDPTITLSRQKITDISEYEADFTAGLKDLLAEMFDTTTQFKPTEYTDRCQLCPYRQLCRM